jgi:hypothetical protein
MAQPAHTADTYREAAGELVSLALDLHEQEQYGPAHYIAGVAVECMLRAYRAKIDPHFVSRHVIESLASESKFYDCVRGGNVEEVSAAITTVKLRWSNDHRYRPARMIEQWLRERGLDGKVQPDERMKTSSRAIVNAAVLIVETGEKRWTVSP